MKYRYNHVLTFFCLACILFSYTFTSLQSFMATNIDNSSLLKFEVQDIFVANLRHTISIRNLASHEEVNGELYVPIIRNETARHYVIYNISSSIGQPTISSDSSDNTYASWSNVIISGEQTLTVELNYYILSFNTRYVINSSLIADYNRSSDIYKKYTQPEELVESDNSEIVSRAQNLTKNASNIQEKASSIYNFVIKHMNYASQDDEKGALWALENGAGDCSEYSYLYVALCRAAGIPARIQAGFAFHYNEEMLEDGHMWAEYYLENYGWIPVDATWKLFATMDCRHFSSLQSIPEFMQYANYVFDYAPGTGQIDEEQNISLKPTSVNVFNDPIVEDVVETVQKMKQARFALFLAKIFGATLIFSSEVREAERIMLESQISLQKAMGFWEAQPQNAQSNVAEALESAEDAAQQVWRLLAYVIILFISMLIIIMLVASAFSKRRQTNSYNS